MKHYKYLIVGGGMTADAAVRGIRERDEHGSIGMISSETEMPYSRPPLTKGMWKGRPFEKIWCGTDKYNVDFHLGCTVVKLETAVKCVRDLEGEEYGYDKLLLATGGSTVRLPFGSDDIIYYRTLKDYQRLRALAEHGERFLVIGAGFIGSEIAASLRTTGKHVSMVFHESSIGENMYPIDLSKSLSDYYRRKGVELVPRDEVKSIEKNGDSFRVQTRGGAVLEVDGIVAGIGVHPRDKLAKSAGIKVDDGILVNDRLQTSATDIFAAGDVARFEHPVLKKSVRVEHEDNALNMGRQAGRNMAGADEVYLHTPVFYSDMFEMGYEAVGELNSKLATVAVWQVPFQKGVVYYMDGGRVNGVLILNLRDKLQEATALLKEAGPFRAEDLIDRIY